MTSYSDIVDVAARAAKTHGIGKHAFVASVIGVEELLSGWRVHYRTASSEGYVDVSRSPLAVASTSQWAPLDRRRLLTWAVGFALLVGGLIALSAQRSPDEWYDRYSEHGSLALTCTLALPFVAAFLVGRLSLHREARSLSTTTASAVCLVGIMATQLFVHVIDRPSLKDAEAAIAAGDLGRAYAAANALNAMTPGSAGSVADAAHLAMMQRAHDLPQLVALAKERWWDPQQAKTAGELVSSAAERELQRATSAADAKGMEEVLGTAQLPPDRVQSVKCDAELIRADRAIANENYEASARHLVQAKTTCGVSDRLNQLVERTAPALEHQTRDELKAARALPASEGKSGALERVTARVQLLTQLNHRFAPTADQLHEESARASKQWRALEDKRVAAEIQRNRAAEAREQARERRRALAPLRCCDGTASPSCVCGGSHRGCCSHHGGVCGCY